MRAWRSLAAGEKSYGVVQRHLRVCHVVEADHAVRSPPLVTGMVSSGSTAVWLHVDSCGSILKGYGAQQDRHQVACVHCLFRDLQGQSMGARHSDVRSDCRVRVRHGGQRAHRPPSRDGGNHPSLNVLHLALEGEVLPLLGGLAVNFGDLPPLPTTTQVAPRNGANGIAGFLDVLLGETWKPGGDFVAA